MITAGELKQRILQVYNGVHQNLFGLGLRQQSIEFAANKITIVDISTRVPILKGLVDEKPVLVSRMDHLLIDVYKLRFMQCLKSELKLNIVAVLKDYDAATELSGTIIVLDRDVSCYYE